MAPQGELSVRLSFRTSAGNPRFVLAIGRDDEANGFTPASEYVLPRPAVEYMETQTRDAIKQLDTICGFDEAQRAKLELASQGDLSRLSRGTRQWHLSYQGISPQDGVAVRAAADALQVLNAQLSDGPKRQDSLFTRVLTRELTVKQSDQLARFLLSNQTARLMQTQGGQLTLDQHAQLVDLLVQQHHQVVYPAFWDEEYYLPLLKRIPHKLLQEFLDPRQLKHIEVLIDRPVSHPKTKLEFR
jgi:hypothetical protein